MTNVVIHSGGCIRLYPATPDESGNLVPRPEWHIDENHATVGLFDTSEPPKIDSAGYLVIGLVDEAGETNTLPVIFLDVEEDETLTARGISAGPSNGGPYMRIRFFDDDLGVLNLTIPNHYAALAGNLANVWAKAEHLLVT